MHNSTNEQNEEARGNGKRSALESSIRIAYWTIQKGVYMNSMYYIKSPIFSSREWSIYW